MDNQPETQPVVEPKKTRNRRSQSEIITETKAKLVKMELRNAFRAFIFEHNEATAEELTVQAERYLSVYNS